MDRERNTASTAGRRTILITGASGVLGAPMCARLEADGFTLVTLGRTLSVQGTGVVCDLTEPEKVSVPGSFDILVHMAPLWLLPDNLDNFVRAGVQRVLAFSSTSVETKRNSKRQPDKLLVESLYGAEQSVKHKAQAYNLELTLFRPTMIYGFCRDKNVTVIANVIKRLGFFPVAGSGSGLRQPVHALDLVESCLRCIDNEVAIGKTYNLSGGETLSYKQMVDRVFFGLNLPPRTIHVAVTVYKALLAVALKLRVLKGISIDVAERMNDDFCFDNGPAQADFGYRGSRFLENPTRDLPHGVRPH